MDDRRARNHARDRSAVLSAMPSVMSWQPAVPTAQIVETVRLPERTVLHLLHELNVDRLAREAGGRWWRRCDVPPPRTYPAAD